MALQQPKQTTANYTEYIAVNVGPDKDNYAIDSFFKHDLLTDSVTVRYTLIKNWIHSEKIEGKVYKKETKFREIIATDTYQRLFTMVKEIMAKEIEANKLVTN